MEAYKLLLMSYLLGSIPFGLIFAYLGGLGDIRTIGSGNIGATNVLRSGNRLIAAATLIADIGKGALAVLITQYYQLDLQYWAGLVAVMAHIAPIWLKFRGGKGVATALGVYLAWSHYLGIITILIWFIIAKIFKKSSLSALVAISITPIINLLLGKFDLISAPWHFLVILIIIIYLTHIQNIKRLCCGQEDSIK